MGGSGNFRSPWLSLGTASVLQTLVLLLVLFNGYATSQNTTKDYTNHTVYRVTLKTQEQTQTFLSYANDHGLDIWRDPSILPGSTDRDADIMVPPAKRQDFLNKMKAIGAAVTTFIPDVQVKINESASAQVVYRRSGLDTLTDQKYFRYDEIVTLLEELRSMYPDLIQLIPIGQTSEGRRMDVVYLSTDHRKSKPAIWVDAGIHAREWIAPAVVLQAIHRLVTDPNAADMLRTVDWYFLPVFNPDGYEYSHTVDRMWRKTRSKRPNSKCYGVDANRNFEYYWKVAGASSNPCSDTYAGPTFFSEPETVNVREFLLKNNKNIKAYLTYHSYGNYLLYPWGFTYELPENSDELDKLAHDVNKSMVKAGSEPYRIGSSTNVLYPAAGGSDDWAKGVANISLVYTIELPGYGFGFELPPQYISPVSNHVFVGLREFAKHVMRSSRSSNETSMPPAAFVGGVMPVHTNRPKPISKPVQSNLGVSRPATVSANRPVSPQKPFFTPTNSSRPSASSRPHYTPANTYYVPQSNPFPYPSSNPYPSNNYNNNYNPQNTYYAGYFQPKQAAKVPDSSQPNPNQPSAHLSPGPMQQPSNGQPYSNQQSGSSNQQMNPSVQSSGSTGYVQKSPSGNAPSGYVQNFGTQQSSNPMGSSHSQVARLVPSTGNMRDIGMVVPSSSNSAPSSPARTPASTGSNLNFNPSFGEVFYSDLPTWNPSNNEPNYERTPGTGAFSFPSNNDQQRSDPEPAKTGGVSFPDSGGEPTPLYESGTQRPVSAVVAADMAPLWA